MKQTIHQRATLADTCRLSDHGRIYMLGWLQQTIDTGPGAVTAEEWNTAYGRAADWETASNARTVLAEAVTR